MVTLFSQEKVSEIHDYNLVKETRAVALAEGRAEGRAEEAQSMILRLLDTLSSGQLAVALKVPVEDILKIAEGSRGHEVQGLRPARTVSA